MDDTFYKIPRTAVVGTANVAQTVAFIAEHERSTNIDYVELDDALKNFSAVVKNVYAFFLLTDLTDAATCKTAHLVADCVRNSRLLSIAIVQSASDEFADELNYLEQNFGAVINLSEQQTNLPAEDFSCKIVHGIHSIYDDEFYPYLMPVDGADLVDLLTCGRKTFVGFGEASGENPTVAAVNAAIDSPLIKNNLQNARSVFLNVVGSLDSLLMLEVNEAANLIYDATNPDGEFYFVANRDDSLGEKIFVMVIVRV
ncbi:MAG: hypothetical protein IJS69_01120 [Selenomonadaceae bacterium]|nr:hypothetical protein [Selenomonadaceae bacterium]